VGSKKNRTADPAIVTKTIIPAAKTASDGRGCWIFGGTPDVFATVLKLPIMPTVVDVKIPVCDVRKQHRNSQQQAQGRKHDSYDGHRTALIHIRKIINLRKANE